MSCQRFRGAIALYVGNDLPGEQLEPLQQHLEECAVCRLLLEQLAADRQWLQRLADRPIEETRMAACRSRVMTEIADQPTKARSSRYSLLALAAALIIALCAMLQSRQWREETAGPPPVTRLEASRPGSIQEHPRADVQGDQHVNTEVEPGRIELEDGVTKSSDTELGSGARERAAPLVGSVAAWEPSPPAVLRIGASALRPQPATSQRPILVKLVSEQKDVVIYWLLDADEPDVSQRSSTHSNSVDTKEQRDDRSTLSRG